MGRQSAFDGRFTLLNGAYVRGNAENRPPLQNCARGDGLSGYMVECAPIVGEKSLYGKIFADKV